MRWYPRPNAAPSVRDRRPRPPLDAHRRRVGRARRGRRSAPRRRRLPRGRPRARPPDQPRRRDPSPQRLRLGRPRAGGADRRDARHRRGRGARRTSTGRSATASRSTSARLRFTALETPGHTPEHVAYAVADRSRADEPLLLFTGGSLLVGAVGRTDLLGEENAHPVRPSDVPLAPRGDPAARGLRRRLPDPRRGSLCSTGHRLDAVVDDRLRAPPQPDGRPADVDAFARLLLQRPAGLPALLRPDAPDQPGRPAAARRAPAGARADGRRRGPLPRSRPGRPASSTSGRRQPTRRRTSRARSRSRRARRSERGWAGWSSPTGRSSSCSTRRPTGTTRSGRRSASGTRDRPRPRSAAGSASWSETGRADREPAAASPSTSSPSRLDRGGPDAPFVIDVRQRQRVRGRSRPGLAAHRRAASLPDRLDELPRDRPIATICASGYRASVAASLLRAAGFTRRQLGRRRRPDLAPTEHPTEKGAPPMPRMALRDRLRRRPPGPRARGTGPARRGDPGPSLTDAASRPIAESTAPDRT